MKRRKKKKQNDGIPPEKKMRSACFERGVEKENVRHGPSHRIEGEGLSEKFTWFVPHSFFHSTQLLLPYSRPTSQRIAEGQDHDTAERTILAKIHHTMSLYGDLPPPSNEGDSTPNKEASPSSSSSATIVKPALPGIVTICFCPEAVFKTILMTLEIFYYCTSGMGRLSHQIQANAQQEAGATKTKARSATYACRICCPIHRNNTITQCIRAYRRWRL